MSDITRRRGDTRRIRRYVTDGSGAAIDITGWTGLLTVNQKEDPESAEFQVMQLVGVVFDGPGGVMDFTPVAADVDWVASYFFDIQLVDTDGGISTPYKGQFTLEQDITKSNPGDRWEADGVDGETVVVDGTEFWYGVTSGSVNHTTLKYATRDSTKVIEVGGSSVAYHAYLYPWRDGNARMVFGNGIFEFSVLGYLDNNSTIEMLIQTFNNPDNLTQCRISSGALFLSTQWSNWDDTDGGFAIGTCPTLPAWVWMKTRFSFVEESYAGGYADSVKTKAWLLGDDEPASYSAEWWTDASTPHRQLTSPFCLHLERSDLAGVLQIASFSWEQVG